MQKNSLAFVLLLLLSLKAWGDPVDTTIEGVDVQFNYSVSIFPESWQGGAIDGKGENIAPEEIARSKEVFARAFKKYPVQVLQTELKTVYCLKSMKFYNVGFGGTNSNEAVYVTNNGVTMGYTDNYVEQTFHHEFSSILFRNHPSYLDTVAWQKSNVPGFDYNDPEAGVGAIRKNESSQEMDTVLCQKGFLTQYAYSSLENDLNTLAQSLFRPPVGFWKVVKSYPRIRSKVSLLITFYNTINPIFTEAYFRKFE